LDQGFSNLDLEKLYCQIHTIKGCCGALGLDVLVEQWSTLERHLHQCRKSNQCHLDGPWQNQWQEIRDDYIEWENLKSQIKIQPEHEIQVDRQRFQALCDDMMSQSQLGDAVSVWAKRLIACQSHAFRKSCQKLKQRIDHLSQALNKGNVQLEILGSEELVHPECERLLSKIMPHLVNNAIDHAFPEVDETVDFKPRITIELESKGTFCRLKFKDNGRGLQMPDSTSGISPDQIFQSGVSSKSDVSDVSGHGVGLTAVQSMLKDCGGEIDVISRSSGTEFNIQIPLNQVGAPLKISDG
jgi:chemotaxis protein histidine kinase CheA